MIEGQRLLTQGPRREHLLDRVDVEAGGADLLRDLSEDAVDVLHQLTHTRESDAVLAKDSVAVTVTGHLTRSVFDRYNIVSPADLQDAARRLSNRNGHVAEHDLRRSYFFGGGGA